MPSRFVLRILVIAMALALAAFASSSPTSNGQPGPALDPAIHTILQPDLTLHSTLLAKTSGFCVGSCTAIRCTSNADCGPGGVCRPFIICGAKTGKIEGSRLSSHRGDMPELNVNCK